MAGSKAGAMKARETNLRLYGKDFYQRVGKMGGTTLKTMPCGFASMDKETLSAISSKGGSASRRGKAKPKAV